jgi:hypothetical protein
MIRKLMAATVASIAVTSLGACAFSNGVKPDANITTSFTKGVSTESDVDARLG